MAALVLLPLLGACGSDPPGGGLDAAAQTDTDGGGGDARSDAGLPLDAQVDGGPSSPDDAGLDGDASAGDGGGDAATDATTEPAAAVALEIEPASVALVVDGVRVVTQDFRVVLERVDGTREDVTSVAQYRLAQPVFGFVDRGRFVANAVGGRTELVASAEGLTARAEIGLSVERVDRLDVVGAAPLPDDPGALFERAANDPGRAPLLVYPNDDVLVPPNLGELEIHFRPGPAGNTLFEVSARGPDFSLLAFQRCQSLGGGCLYAPSAELYAMLAETVRGRGPVELRVRATDDAGQSVGASETVRLNIAATPVQGAIYYWTTSAQSIMRVEFGPGAEPERFFPFESTQTCYGCHAISRDGRRMSLSRNGMQHGQLTLLDVAQRGVVLDGDDAEREQFQSWNPTSDRFVGAWSDRAPWDTNLRIRSGVTGAVVETIALGVQPTHPDWSPVGDRIAFTRVTHHAASQRPGRGGISYVQKGATGWSAPIDLVPPGDGFNRYYPTYAPDGRFLLYNESICRTGVIYDDDCDADADEVAKLWAIASHGGAPLQLARANAPGVEDQVRTALSNTYPKWAPFVDARTRGGEDRVMWFTFASRRMYGLRAPRGSDQLLWMAAVDPEAILEGRDGSWPAFALPFQDLQTSNHIAQWTARLVPPDDAGPGDGGDAGVGDDAGVGGDAGPEPHDGGPDPGGSDGGVDGGPDPGGFDAGVCLHVGAPCDPAGVPCCPGSECHPQGGGVFVCRSLI